MASQTVLIQSQREYSLVLPSGATSTLELVRYVGATTWVSGVLLITLYAKGAWAVNVVATITAQNVTPARDDPKTLYLQGTNASTSIDYSDTAPKLYTVSLAAPLGNYLRVVLSVTNGSGGTVTADFTIGVSLVGRDA